MATLSDRRTATRYDVVLPLQVRLANGAWAEPPSLVDTYTKDISTSGIAFTLSEGCELGSAIDCILILPGGAPDDPPVQLRLRGKVVRVYQSDLGRYTESARRVAVGATIEEYSLQFK